MARQVARRAGRPMDTHWVFTSASFLAQAAGNAALTVLTAGTRSQTLLRTRGEILMWFDGTTVAGDAVRITYGMQLVQGGQGTTVVSSPLTDGEAPWIIFGTALLAREESTASPGLVARHVIDNKAMRIIRGDRELQFVVEVTDVGTAQPVNIGLGLRFLFGD